MGLLDFLTDPEFQARIEERRRLAEYLAGQLGVTPAEARDSLDSADAAAMEAFCEGNTIPREERN